MTNRNLKQEACQVYIEQEIDDRLKDGMKPGEISRELTKEVNVLFEATVKPATIKKRAQRMQPDVGTFVPTPTDVSEVSDATSDDIIEIEKEVQPDVGTNVPTSTDVSDKIMKRRTLRLSPELDNSIIEYRDEYDLKHSDAFVELLELGLKMTPVLQKILEQISIKELQDVVSKAVILSKGAGVEQSVKEVLDDIIDYYLYQIEQARLQRTETEQR